jgi:TM2 domain-containing membrane protein YozV
MNGSHDSHDGANPNQGAQPDPGQQAAYPQGQPGAYPPPPMAAPQPARSDPRAKSPALACILSVMPGLGQIYIGYYARGFVHALVVFTLITLLADGNTDELTPLVGLFLAFFWLYNILDAGRRAVFYNSKLTGSEATDLAQEFQLPSFGGSIFGGVTLIILGFVLLLYTRFDISLSWLRDWWPVIPIGLGVYLLVKALQERGPTGGPPASSRQGEPGGAPPERY